jgi:hypothetical protein
MSSPLEDNCCALFPSYVNVENVRWVAMLPDTHGSTLAVNAETAHSYRLQVAIAVVRCLRQAASLRQVAQSTKAH